MKVSRLNSKNRFRDEGFGAAGILLLFGFIAVVWWAFMFVMDGVRDNHQRKVQDRMGRFDSYKRKNRIDYSHREAKGYRVRR